jgi:hypothetical protein
MRVLSNTSEEMPMDKNRFAAILVVFLVLVLPASGLSQSVEDMRKEMSTLESEIARLDKMIQDNSVLVAMLRGHGTRLRVVADDPNVYRLPLLIEGRVVYTTVDDAELEDFSLSLALEDLLIRHRVSKGSFRSDDPAEWKRILMKESRESREHLQRIELPAVKNRIDVLDQETHRLEAQRSKLYERYKMLQQKVGGA